MSDLHLGRVRTLLFDPQSAHRQTTLGVLHTLGLTQIEPIASASEIKPAIEAAPYELLVAELQGAESELCNTIRDIRHRRTPASPFLVIILTTWDINADAVRAVLNSGADDLIARPYTVAQMQQRLNAAVFARKPFVVTVDYVGPSRRASPRNADQNELFVVPNALRARAIDDGEPGLDIEVTWRTVMRWKAIRLSRQLETWSASLMSPAVGSEDADGIGHIVRRMTDSSIELQRYAIKVGKPAFNAVADYCAQLQLVSSRTLDEANLRRFTEVAALLTHQVRIATIADHGESAGAVPYLIA